MSVGIVMQNEPKKVHVCAMDGLRCEEVVCLKRDTVLQSRGKRWLTCRDDVGKILYHELEIGEFLCESDAHMTKTSANLTST